MASHAASSVAIDLTGAALKSGSNIVLTSTEALDPASIYYYSVSGTLTTTGTTETALDFQDVLSGSIGTTGTATGTLAGLVANGDEKLTPFLSSTVPDISGTFPFTVVNVLESGTFLVTTSTSVVHTTLRIKVSVDKTTGLVDAKISNVDFGIKVPKKGVVKDKDDSFTFEGGSIVVSSSLGTLGTLADPDLSFDVPAPVGLVGVTTSGTAEYPYPTPLKKGKSASAIVYLVNTGTTGDIYTLKVSGTTPDYINKFVYAGANVTKEVTGTSGFTLPPQGKKVTKELDADDAKTLTWIVKFTGTTTGTSDPVLTGSSTETGSVDAAQLVVTGSAP